MRLLVIEDEVKLAQYLRKGLSENGHVVDLAHDGIEGRRLALGGDYDLVLLDIMLPKKNGFEVCQTIRANPAWQSVRIVMLTAKGRDTEVAKGTALGADAYMTKPFSTKDLIAQVRQILGDS